MNLEMWQAAVSVLFLVMGFGVGWYLSSRSGQNKIASAKEMARKTLEDAEKAGGHDQAREAA